MGKTFQNLNFCEIIIAIIYFFFLQRHKGTKKNVEVPILSKQWWQIIIKNNDNNNNNSQNNNVQPHNALVAKHFKTRESRCWNQSRVHRPVQTSTGSPISAPVNNHTRPYFLCMCVCVCEGADVLSGTPAVAQSVGHPVDWRDFPERL